MSLATMQLAIADSLAGVEGVKACAVHAGRFELAQLRRYTAKSPCVLMACLGGDLDRVGGGGVTLSAQWAAFIIAQDAAGAARKDTALAVVELVALAVVDNAWADYSASGPRNLKVQNLYTDSADARGVALWAVTWDQACLLDAGDAPSYEPLHLIDVTYDVDDTDAILLDTIEVTHE